MANLIWNGSKQTTAIAVLLLMAAAVGTVAASFQAAIQDTARDIDLQVERIAGREAALARMPMLEKQFRELQVMAPASESASDAVNQWVKEVLGLAQARGITISRLEPRSLFGDKKKNTAQLLISFSADIRKLTAFLRDLAQMDPGANLNGIAIKNPDGSGGLPGAFYDYELILERNLS